MENKNELPKMTIEQRNAIVNPIIGLEIIDSDTNELMRFDGIEFVRINNHKQEAIKKAYGEYWDNVKKYVDEDGWLLNHYQYREFINEFNHDYRINKEFGSGYLDIRPKQLAGIENNNGWISVNDRLPTDNSFYWVFAPKVLSNPFICEFIVEYKEFIENMIYTDLVTHWQPIQVTPKPIY